MTIIDPMHNGLLGVVKVFWLSALIQSHALREQTRGGVCRELDYFNLWIKYVRLSFFALITHNLFIIIV